MSSLSSKAVVVSFAALAIASQACTLASPTEVSMVPAKTDSAATDGADPKTAGASGASDKTTAGGKCDAKLAKVDVSKLTACGNPGGGHCYPKSKIPGGGTGAMACANADEVCVADVILEAGGDKLVACKVQAMGGAEGVCIPLGPIAEGPEKELAKTNLKQDVCAEGLVCSPCIDIRTNTPTGMCGSVGVSDGACGGGTSGTAGGDAAKPAAPPAAACCGGKGTCLSSSGLGTAADKMNQDSCSEGQLCAPQSLVSGQAKKCDAGMILGKGVCMSGCFNDTLDNIGGVFLAQETCDEGDLCVPCKFASMMAPDGTKVPGCE